MRLDKYLSNSGFGSRKDVRKIIKKGMVTVNDDVQKNVSVHIDANEDEIRVAGEIVEYNEFIYLMLNKPAGYLSATTDKNQVTVLDLIEGYDHYDLFPVGRLDIDTEGLLLLTNDGKLSHKLLSPKHHVPKKYLVYFDEELSDNDVYRLQNSIELEDGYICKPAKVMNVSRDGDNYTAEIIITEGKYHQVKRMFQAVGKHVKYLRRISMGTLELDDMLELGEYRELSSDEIMLLKEKEAKDE